MHRWRIYLDYVLFFPKDLNYVAFVNFSDWQGKTHSEHFWIVLRFHPKWVAHMESAKLKKKINRDKSRGRQGFAQWETRPRMELL
jgi:hypothetical protein